MPSTLIKYLKKKFIHTHSSHSTLYSVLIAGSILVGVVASLFAYCAKEAEQCFFFLLLKLPWIPLIITPVSFVILTYLTIRFMPLSSGSGIPQAIAALEAPSDTIRSRILNVYTVTGKFILTLGGFLCGASVGREGPTVFISSGLMYFLSYLPLNVLKTVSIKRALITAGGAAGIAAAFYTPLGGITFALEEFAQGLESRLTKILLFSIMLSGFVCVFFFHQKQYFADSSGQLVSLHEWLIVPTCGVIGGLCGGLFSFLLLKLSPLVQKLSFKHRLYFSGIAGLLVAIIGILSSNMTFGSSYGVVNALLSSHADDHLWFGPIKILTILLTYLSGFSGGILAPTLAAGTGLGAIVMPFFPHASQTPIIILAMGSYFTGVIRSPITCSIIVLEMTGRYDLAIPLLGSVFIAEGIASRLGKKPLYHALAERIMESKIYE